MPTIQQLVRSARQKMTNNKSAGIKIMSSTPRRLTWLYTNPKKRTQLCCLFNTFVVTVYIPGILQFTRTLVELVV
jgi:hypothetical protein